MSEHVCIVLTGDPDFIRDSVHGLYPCLGYAIELKGLRSEGALHVLRMPFWSKALQDAQAHAVQTSQLQGTALSLKEALPAEPTCPQMQLWHNSCFQRRG